MKGNVSFPKKCTRHADAGVVPNAIQTSAVILAGVWSTLVDILFTPWPSVTPNTVTSEGAIGVHTLTAMLARVGTWGWKGNWFENWTKQMHVVYMYRSFRRVAFFLTNAAFISIDVAGAAYISRWTVAVEHATDGIGVTLRALSAGVTDTGVISMAQQTWKG